MVMITLYARQKKRHRCLYIHTFGLCGRRQSLLGGMIWENSIETCIFSIVKQIASPGLMHETSAQGWYTRITQRDGMVSGNVWREDSYVLSLMSPLSLFKRNSTLLAGTGVIVRGRLGSPLVNILFRTKLLSLVPLSWDMDCVLTLWLTLPLVPLVMVAVRLVFWSLSFSKDVSCTAAYIYS